MNNKGIPIVFFAVLLLYCTVLLTYKLTFIGTETVLLSTLIWSVVFIKRFKTISVNSRQILFLSFLFFAIIITYKLVGISTCGWEIVAGYAGWLMSCIFGIYSVAYSSYKQTKRLLACILIVVLLNALYFIYSARGAKQIGFEFGAVVVTSALFSTMFMLFSGVLLVLLLNSKNWSIKILSVAVIAVVLYLNFVVLQRGTNVILTVLMFGLILVSASKINKIAYLSVLVIGVLMFLSVENGFYVDLLQWVEKEAAFSPRVASRIHSILLYVKTGDYVYAGTSLKSRMILLTHSWDTFKSSYQNMLFGAGDHRTPGILILRSSNILIGNHFELIDMLARYGILFSAILYILLINHMKFIKECFANSNSYRTLYHQSLILYLIYILRNIWGDALASSTGIIMFIMLPCAIKLIVLENARAINEGRIV